MLDEIKKTKEKVEYILTHYPESRNNDMLLCQLYWQQWDNVHNMSDLHNATPAEAITRNRRKFQSLGLYKADKKVKEGRLLNAVDVRMGINAI
ncbi:hypothetical protein ACI3ER_11445 [Bacillus sp. Wb]